MDSFSKADRRLFERLNVRFPVNLHNSRHGGRTEASLQDVSAKGAKIVTPVHLFCNDQLTLEIEIPDGRNPLVLKGGVVWTKNIEPHVWDIGVRFDDIRLMRLARLCQFTENIKSL